MIEEGKVFSGKGYEYNDDNGKTFIKFHVNDNPSFSDNTDIHPFGGNLSVQKQP